MKRVNHTEYIRWLILFGILGFISVNAVIRSIERNSGHNVHTICPFGGIESIYQFITTGLPLRGIAYSSFVILAATLILAIFAGRGFCGWICPLGALQELLSKIGFVLFKKRLSLPTKFDKVLKYLKYVVLIIVAGGTWYSGTLIIRSIDPWSSYLSILGMPGGGEYIYVGITLLIALMAASLFYDRFFCRYICPLGAVIAIVSLPSSIKIKRNEGQCIKCGICNNVCPMGIDIMHSNTITSAECISCQLCTASCPVENTLTTKLFSRKLSPLTYGLLVIVIFFSVILVSAEMGLFNTRQISLKNISTVSKQALTPESIRGSSTLKEISEAFSIPLKKLYKALKLSEKDIPSSMKLKDIKKKIEGFETDKVREVVKSLLEAQPN